MSITFSSNMNLPIPGVGTENGPQFAFDINNSLTLIDRHDHSPGLGVLITPLGLNINIPLSFQNNLATNVQGISFFTQDAQNTTTQTLYAYPGGEFPILNDLWYFDGTNQVQITKAGALNAPAASIPGQSYAGGTFTWKQGSGSTTPANFDIGSVTIRPNVASTANGVTLSPPSSISSAYSIDLPLLPASTSFVTMNSSGVQSTLSLLGQLTTANLSPTANILGSQLDPAADIVGTQLDASADILGSQLSPTAGIVPTQLSSIGNGYSAQSGSLTQTVTSPSGATLVTGSGISITNMTTTRPVFLTFIGGDFRISTGGDCDVTIVKTNGTSTITVANFSYSLGTGTGGQALNIPASSCTTIDLNPGALTGTTTYQVLLTASGSNISIQSAIFTAVQV